MGGDHSCYELLSSLGFGLECMESQSSFRPLLLNLYSMLSQHIHRYSYLFN